MKVGMVRTWAGVCCLFLTLGVPSGAASQTREQGPWWPHPIWGKDDQAGASNWITAAKVLEAVKLVRSGKIYELGQPYDNEMPLFTGRAYLLTIPGRPTSGPLGKNRLVYNDDLLTASIGQVGTQFDGLGHVGTRMKMADGATRDVFYNGFTMEDFGSSLGLRKLGIEHVKPFITRGVLVDVAGYKRVDILPAGYEVTVADVRGALARQGIDESSIRTGDALLFRYGMSRLWKQPAATPRAPAGIGMEVARWIVERQPSMVGSDAGGLEVASAPDIVFPIHQELLTKNGIYNLENMVFDELAADAAYEFLFVFTPIRFVGATGSPGRPLAIR